MHFEFRKEIKNMKQTRKLVALLLVVCMVLSIISCGIAPKEEKPTLLKDSILELPDGNPSDKVQPLSNKVDVEELSREEKEQIVETLVSDTDPSTLSDKELNTLVNGLLSQLEKEDEKPIAMEPAVEDAYDQDGAMTVPFDVAYPDLVENGDAPYDEGTLLVKMAADATLSASLKDAGAVSMEKIVPMGKTAWFELNLSKNVTAKESLQKLRALEEVILAEFNYEIKTAALDDYKHFDDKTDKEFKKNGHNKDQWHFHHCGIPDGYQEMENAGGSSSVVVAVIDSGVDYDHEDLKDNIWVNTAEIPDNKIDDDKNGYVDDYYGVDVIAGKGNGDDDNGHGTHVAGIIAADNNNTGVVGIAYNVKIMPIKAAMHNGTLNQADIAEGIYYAYEMGAEVINMSFGGSACTIAVQDALATAYTRCVLVASAGNDGYPNEEPLKPQPYLPNYPAALSYVLGVMSVDENGVESSFTNWDAYAFNGIEYELYAPGEEIMSTLPDDRYGFLSGTSMAAPVVSAMAAILRSEFSDRDMYPTKFIYGQLSSTSEIYADCLDPEAHGPHNIPQVVDLNAALTKLPKPELGLNDFAIFDSPSLSAKNNGDGVIDAGETIALGLTLRNRWGMSENTMVTIDTLENGISDPYVTIVNPTVDYGSVGTYSTGDCGKIYTDGLLTGWENPFIIKIAEDCPNDYRMTFHVTIRCGNALDEEDTAEYVFGINPPINVNLTARNGVILPSIIDKDMILTPENLYIIPNSTVIRQGVTVRVLPGTHIQFWSDDAKDPYADSYMAYLRVEGIFLVEGTRENPVYIYPSQLMDTYNVEMGSTDTGYISLVWADVTNLYVGNGSSIQASGLNNRIDFADHCAFRQNYGVYHNFRYLSSGLVIKNSTDYPLIGRFTLCQNSVFYKQGDTDGYAQISGAFDRCLFVDCGMRYGDGSSYGCTLENCVFLGNNFVDQTRPNNFSKSSLTLATPPSDPTESQIKICYVEETGTTYISSLVSLQEEYLEQLGGAKLVIETETEANLLKQFTTFGYYYQDLFSYSAIEGKCTWWNGAPIGDFIAVGGVPYEKIEKRYLKIESNKLSSVNNVSTSAPAYLYEIPGKILPTDIAFLEYEVDLDLEGTYQISPINTPVQLTVDSFLYESRDERVVKVDKNGLVTPVGKGTTDVYVYSEDRAVYNYVTFNVVDYVALEDFTFTAEKDVVAIGETLATKVEFTPANTTRKNVVYTSSDENIIKVDVGGNLTGITSGTATITAICEGISKSITVRSFVKATSINIESLALTMSLDTPPVLPEVVVSSGGEPALQWTSTDEEVLKIVDNKPALLKEGTTTLIVKDVVSGLSDSVLVYVSEKKMPKVIDLQIHYSNAYALLEDGKLYQWGSTAPKCILENVEMFSSYNGNVIGLLSDGSLVYVSESSEKLVFNLPGFDEKIVDFTHYFSHKIDRFEKEAWITVVSESGKVYTWEGLFNEPTIVPIDEKIIAIKSSAYEHSFLSGSGNLYLKKQSYETPKLIARNVTYFSYNSGSRGVAYISEGKGYVYANQYSTTTGSYTGVDMLYNVEQCYDEYDFVFIDPYWYGTDLRLHNFIGVKEGNAHLSLSNTDESKYNVSGMGNVIATIGYNIYDLSGGTAVFATEDGIIYGIGSTQLLGGASANNATAPVVIPIFQFDETLQIAGTNLDDSGFLSEPKLKLNTNKELVKAKVKLYENGTEILSQAEWLYNELTVSSSIGFVEGAQYRLVISQTDIQGSANVNPSEDITLTFTYSSKTPDAPDAPDAPVIHEAVTDPSIERILTPEALVADYDEWMETYQINSTFYGNAILNHFTTDTEVTHWLRPLAPSDSGVDVPLGGNWWGTTSEKAIELQMIDYRDFANYGLFRYAPYLTTAPEDTFPFIVDLSIYNKDGEKVTTVGNETITVRITFNRDMDTSIPLQVRFGSAYPYGDYEIEGKYVDARTWEGTYTLTTVIENGNQLFTVSNGFSATDDLEFYTDRGRFGFVIDTTAAQALIMQGYSTDTGIQLSWTQDDFDTLMGYNVYRSTKEDGLYTRLNTSVIPASQMTFFDGTVEPGVKYYYNFTVVQTDLTESTPSGKITITSRDTMAPDIYHTPVYTATTGKNLIITATVTDNYRIEYARIFYRTVGESEWKSVMMQNLNSKFSAIISASELSTAGLEYYIVAFDGVSETYKGTADEPWHVTVQLAVDANAMGDVDGNGVIEVRDALMLLQARNDQLNLTAEQFLRADINKDGELATSEALTILQYVSGKITAIV